MTLRDKLQDQFSTEAANYLKIYNRGIGDLCVRFGKTKTALMTVKKLFPSNFDKPKILVSYPDNKIKESWEKDIIKWGYQDYDITLTNTSSLKNYVDTQFDIVITDECFTGETEILTEKGFVPFKALEKNIKVAQWEQGNIEFVQPLKYINKPYEGELINFRIKQNISVPITPNHEHVFLNKKKEICREKIKDLKTKCSNNYKSFCSGKSYSNKEEQLSVLERMFIIAQADGSIHANNKENVKIAFSFEKLRKKERFLNILLESKLPFMKCKNQEKNPNKERWIVTFPINSTKILSNHIKYPMSYEKAYEIIEEMVNWDGSIMSENSYYFSSVEKENADFYNQVATIAGHSCYMSIQKDNRKETYKDVYRLFILKNKSEKSMQNFNVKDTIFFNGNVYCVSVPSKNIVLRHNGYTFISGNCHSLSEAQIDYLKEIYNSSYVLGLSGTLSDNTLQVLDDQLDIKVIAKYSIEQGIKDGIVADYSLTVHTVALDTIKKKKNSNGKLVSEKEAYDNITKLIDSRRVANPKFLYFNRTRILQGSLAKLNKTKELIKQLDGRYLVFTGLTKVCDDLKIPSYYAKKKDKTDFDAFQNKKINILGLAESGKMGISYNDLNGVILPSFTGNEETTAQLLLRCILLDYNGKIGDIHIITSEESAELKKLDKTLAMLDKTKIKWK